MKAFLPIIAALAVLTLVACSDPNAASPGNKGAQRDAIAQAEAVQNSVAKTTTNPELRNYNERIKVADNPATVIWCTAFPSQPGTQPITVPIVGKLTSGSKRPSPGAQAVYTNGDTSGTYSPDLPDQYGFYGSSGEYRYGFTPAGMYVDFYGMETFCTNEPTLWQREKTTIVIDGEGEGKKQ